MQLKYQYKNMMFWVLGSSLLTATQKTAAAAGTTPSLSLGGLLGAKPTTTSAPGLAGFGTTASSTAARYILY